MNGRVYDPLTAMFFSPDPFIQSPGDWSNYNRYSYCMNNPTRYTDPSGYIFSPMSTVGDEPAYYYEGTCTPINVGGGAGRSVLDWWDAQHGGSISYNWETRQYEYSNGNVATYGEAMNQLLNGNLDYNISFEGKNASQFYDYYSKGYSLYAVNAFGRINYVAALGDLGKIYYSSDGAIGFSGMFVGAVIGLGTGEDGIQDNNLSKLTTALAGINGMTGFINGQNEFNWNQLTNAQRNKIAYNIQKGLKANGERILTSEIKSGLKAGFKSTSR